MHRARNDIGTYICHEKSLTKSEETAYKKGHGTHRYNGFQFISPNILLRNIIISLSFF